MIRTDINRNRMNTIFIPYPVPSLASLITSSYNCPVIGQLSAASEHITHAERRNTDQDVQTRGSKKLTKVSGYRKNEDDDDEVSINERKCQPTVTEVAWRSLIADRHCPV